MQKNLTEKLTLERDFNLKKLSECGYKPEDTELLLSFPRSGNGWIRVVISVFLASELDKLVNSSDIKSISFYSLVKELGVTTRALSLGHDKWVSIDSYVPDLYQYSRVQKALANKELSGRIETKPRGIFKSHHLVSRSSDFHSIGVLLRDPKQCLISATHLFNSDLMDKPIEEMVKLLEENIEAYTVYLESFVEMIEEDNIFLIPFSRPEGSLARWLKFSFENKGLDHSVRMINKRLISITKAFPHRSGYDTSLNNRIDVTSLAGYDQLTALYDVLISSARSREFSRWRLFRKW